jgi:hypothetical protein
VDSFFEIWNKYGESRNRLLEKYAKEIQKDNPDYPLSIRFNYYGSVNHFLADVTVKKDGTIERTYIRDIPNPNPNQSSIK